MPTARELLEQADALMRRNRAAAAALEEIPELTDEVAVAAAAVEARAQTNEIAAEAVAINVGAIAADTEAVAINAGTISADAEVVAIDAGAVATDGNTIVTDTSEPKLRSDVAAARTDDVPELTDAVAYVDAVSIEALPAEDPEVSRWFESELGAASITGPAPDSIALVAPAVMRRPDAAATVREPESATEVPGEAAEAAVSADELEALTLAEKHELEALAPLEDRLLAPLAPPEGHVFEPLPVEERAAEVALDASPVASSSQAFAEASFDAEIEAITAATAESNTADDARWAALAEDIRMQVLQRIDIFTDTGLQQQLAARLQPIVDRASADLVAAINQHVGTLLRGYVAEAIEREIERWRQDGH